METTQLRQLANSVEIVGTLKSKELEVKTSRAGNQYMSGKLVVVSKFDNKINEQSIKVMVMATSKLFKGIETVKNEYKSIDEHGEEVADRVRITGELKLNEYYNSQGTLVRFNEIKGVFYNRLEPADNQPDKSIASIETIIDEFVPELDKEQLPTGNYLVKGFTVGYGNDVVELQKAVVNSDLAQAFMNLYQSGQTGRLTFKLNNYVEVEEKEVEVAAPTHGFGSQETVTSSNTIKNYVSNLEVIGGDMPYFGTKEYTQNEIETAKQVRALKLQTLQAPAPSTPPTNTGFGQGAPSLQDVANQMPSNMMNGNEMPDF